MEQDTVQVPEDLSRLLREVFRRHGTFGEIRIARRMGGGWSARFGNQVLLSPDRRRDTWLLLEYPPPRKALSETVVEVGP